MAPEAPEGGGTLAGIKSGLGCLWKVVQFCILVYAIVGVFGLRDLWLETVPESATVLTVQMEGFWGPVHVLVPTRCRRFKANDALLLNRSKEDHTAENEKQENKKESPAQEDQKQDHKEEQKQDHKKESHAEEDQKQDRRKESNADRRLESPSDGAADDGVYLQPGFSAESEVVEPLLMTSSAELLPRLAVHAGLDDFLGRSQVAADGSGGSSLDVRHQLAEAPDEMKGVTFNATHITVERCGKTLHFQQPTSGQRYWAMVFLSGQDTMSELRNSRCRMLWLLIVGCIAETIINAVPKIIALLPEDYQKLVPTQEDQLADQPVASRAIGGLINNICAKWSTMQSQFGILSLFFIYWHDDYYVTSFVPGKAYLCIIGIYAMLPMIFFAYSIDKTGQNPCIPLMACFFCCFMGIFIVCVAIPLVGYSWYNINFLWNTALAEAVTKETHGLLHYQGSAEYLKEEKILKSEWGSSMQAGCAAIDWICGAHTSEIVMDFALTLAEAFI